MIVNKIIIIILSFYIARITIKSLSASKLGYYYPGFSCAAMTVL